MAGAGKLQARDAKGSEGLRNNGKENGSYYSISGSGSRVLGLKGLEVSRLRG